MSESMSLYQIDETIAQLIDAREEMTAAGEDTAAVDSEIARYLGEQLPAKVDGIRGFILHNKSVAEAAEEEAKRLLSISSECRNRVKRLKDYVLFAMNAAGKKKLEGRTGGSISVQANGGVVPLIVDNAALLPDDYCDMVGAVPAWLWKCMMDAIKYEPELERDIQGLHLQRQPNTARIRAALEAPCELCEGYGEPGEECPSCRGTGKRGVPGCSLGERGQHVKIR